jgi:hypothetical protein
MNDSVKHILRHIQKLETVLFRKDYNRWVRLRDSIQPITDQAKKNAKKKIVFTNILGVPMPRMYQKIQKREQNEK